ncbi:MAG: PAS domain S-box protein [Chloroflexi bacterium]|nr:PAS domain S-box protein [Chloroflexota bacterium]
MNHESSLNVLLVEDNPTDVLLLQNALETDHLSEFALTHVERLEDGLRLLAQAQFDIVLVDLGLPDSSGLETFVKLHAQAPGLPVVVFSGNEDEEQAVRAVEAGAQDYLVKGMSGFEMAPRAIRYAIERQKQSSALQRSEQRFSVAFHASPTAQAITSATNQQLVMVNDSYCNLTGYRRGELIGRTTAEMNFWVDLGDQKRMIEQWQSMGHIKNTEMLFRHRSGGVLTLLVSLEPIELDGMPCIISTVMDITERKLAEKELKESEERFSTAFFTSPVAQSIIDPAKGEILAVNDSCCSLFEYSRRELIGANPEKLMLWANSAERLAATEELQRTDHLPPRETKIRTKSGEIRTVIAAIEPIQWGGTSCFISSVLDITERKQAEERVRISEGQLEALVTSLDDIVFEVDENGTYLNVWTSNEAMLFKPREQVIGKRFDEIFGKEVGRPFFEYLARTLDGGTPQTLEYPVDIAGSQHWFAARFSPIHSKVGERKAVSILVRDITERIQSEKMVKQWADAFENCAHGIAIGLPTTNLILTCNSAFARLQDRTVEEISSMPILSMYVPQDHEFVRDSIAKADQVGHVSYEAHMLRKDGSIYPVQMDVVSVKDENGDVLYRVASQQDITDRKQAELIIWEKLKLQEQLEKTAAIVPGMIHIFKRDADGKFSMPYASPAFRDVYGLEAAEVANDMSPAFTRIDPRDVPHIQATIAESARSMNPWRDEFRYHHPQKGLRWLEGHSTPVMESDGSILWYGIIEDFTERKRVEEKVHQSEERLRLTLETTSDGFWIVDANRRFMDVNEAYCSMSGYTRAEFLQLSISDVEVLESLENTQNHVKKIIETGADRFETRHRRKDGDIFDVEVSVNLLDREQGLMICFCRDITERKRSEALIYAQRDLAGALGKLDTTEDGFRIFLESILNLTGLDSGGIYLFDENFGSLDLIYHQGLSDSFIQQVAHFTPDSPNVQMLLPGRPHYFPSSDPVVQNPMHKREGLTALAVVPFLYQERVVGCLNLASHTLSEVTEYARHVLETLSAEIGNFAMHLRAREALRESEEKYRTLITSTMDGVFVAQDEKFIFANPALPASLGYDMEEFENIPFEKVLAPEYLGLFTRRFHQRVAGESPVFNYQVQFMNKTWTNKVWFELRANLTTYQGRPAVLGIARDITERKQSEEALRESEERYRQAITAADAIPYALDYTTDRYAFVGEGIEKLTGISASEFSPGMFAEMHLESIMQGNLKGMHVVEAIQLVRQGKAGPLWQCDHRIRTRSGTIRWYSDSAIQILGEDGIPRSSIGIIQDITERKQAEDKLRQRLTELEVLYTSGLILNRLSSPQEIGKKVIELLEQKMHWHHSVIRLHNPEERSLSLLAFSQPTLADEQEYQKVKDLLEKSIMGSGEGLSGWAVQNNQAIRVNNISEDPRYRESYTGMHSGLYVPISLGENVIGVISIESEKPDGFSESDERFVATLSNQAAIAIENARLNNDLERRVRERTAEVQDLYDNAPTGYHSLDSNGRFVRVNRTELNWLGYSQEELLGRPVAEFLTERSVARFRENFPVFKKNGSLRDLELEFIRKDGSTMPSLINAIAIYDTQGNYMMSHSTVFDNTERKKAEVSLRESQENLQYFFDTASELIQSMDENGNYQYVNNAWSRTLGYSSREALQMTMADVIDPSYQEHCQELLSSLIADQHLRQMEVVFRNKAGEPVIVDGSVSSRKDKSGHIVTNGIFRNITERKKAEDALRASEARLNFLLSKTPAMIFSANLTYPLPITFMSDSAREIVGYEPQQYYEDPGFWLNLVHPDDVDTGMLAMQGLIEKGHVVWESRILRPDGNYQWMSTGASLLLGEKGQPREIIGFTVNIDDRKQAEEALRESEEQNRLLFEEAPESVVLLDDHGRILRMNRAFETLTGHPREILLGRRAEQTDLLPPQEMQSLLQSIEENVRSGAEFTSSNFKLIRADGTPRDVRVNVFPLRIQGRIHYLSTMHDVTAEKQAEETLRLANSELERALRLKDEFLANMSHELRTPLNAILGISESLMEQVAGPLNDKQLKYTQTVHESGQHLLALINDVLDLAKINAGKVELEMSRVEAAAIAQSCLRLVRELAQKKSLELSLDLDPAVSLFLADERRLKQMIVNLLSNAVKFTPSGGRVGLQIRGDAHNRILHFSVWDTGIGIPPDEIQYLFQPFVQLDAGLARDAQGTGLGLVLVSQMARLHGGSVRVESQPGQGSRFTISIPWRAAAQTGSLRRAAQPNRNSAPAPEGNQRPTILLVEDTEAVSMLIHDYLESHGYQVFVARNGFEGITQAQQLRPKLILMDVMMPEMDGLETTRRLRSLPRFEHTPIVALTALAMPGDRDRCLAAGMNDYLSKPVKLSEVLEIIEQYITRDDKGKT